MVCVTCLHCAMVCVTCLHCAMVCVTCLHCAMVCVTYVCTVRCICCGCCLAGGLRRAEAAGTVRPSTQGPQVFSFRISLSNKVIA